MSLIICSECGKEISDKASVCVHCGYPIKKEKDLHTKKKFVYMCMSDACLSNPFKEFDEYKDGIQVCPDCGKQLEYYETEIIDNNTNLVVERSVEESQKDLQNTQFSNKPKCPTCHSADIKKVSVTSKVTNTALFGIFGTKRYKTFHCNNCGYEW
ncbi:MAG: zinc-ribbon domain-containing protein [Lachnospiraceae bacterium]|nr:zinc-ribbon domain-containing protein [Lachnospiraceae bacterium]